MDAKLRWLKLVKPKRIKHLSALKHFETIGFDIMPETNSFGGIEGRNRRDARFVGT